MKNCRIRRFLFYLFIFAGLTECVAQQKFRSVSGPEKRWALFHPFVAKKALRITRKIVAEVDSLRKAGTVGADLNGGKLDAFKHAYWMASLSLNIGSRKALKLGKAHEKGNYREFKKSRLEDSMLPDSVSSVMDLYNNENGIRAMGNCKTFRSEKEIQVKIMEALNKGLLMVIKKDKSGNYLYCDGTLINMSEWEGKWNIPKCLVSSDTQ
jgi:hypothetical protein